MRFKWETARGSEWIFAAARVDSGFIYYVGLAVIVAIMVGTLIAFYRTWMEVHEDEEPDSPRDLLESFREAHAAGQIDDGELERVRRLLSIGEGEAAVAGSPGRPPGPPSAEVGTSAPEDAPDSEGPDRPAPRSI